MGATTATTTHLVLLPDLASGHLMSLIRAGMRMSSTVTVLLVHPLTPDSAAKVAAQVQRVDPSVVRFHRLPPVDPAPDPFPDGQLPAFKSRYMQLCAPHVDAALAALRPAPGAVLLDFFATAALDAVLGRGIPAYVYFTSTAAMLALMLRLPALREDFADMEAEEGTVLLDDVVPGMKCPVPAACVPEFLARRDSPNFSWFAYHGRRFTEADGVVVNTVAELEQGVLDAIELPNLYPIGPVIADHDLPATPGSSSPLSNRCVAWLDAQPAGSVVYLCFGSIGFLAPEQARELAAGLERSGHGFLWVLRGPPAPGTTDSDAAALQQLPEGFLDRTAARGIVWPAWAPQREILAHAAVGAFVTHAGWNSCLESLCSGVPMVPWPLYAEQSLNAFQAVAEMGVAVPLDGAADANFRGGRNKKKKLVEAEAVERAVRSVMGGTQEGRSAREKAMRMKHLCRDAVAPGGSSHAAMQRLCNDIRRRAGATAAAAVEDSTPLLPGELV